MPSEYLFLSSPLPSMQDGGSLREQVDKLTNILLQTQEGLRYALRNLDGSNFNAAGLREILEPVTVRLEDGMKELRTELSITAEGLALDVASLESELQLKIGSDELAAAIEDVNGDVAAVSLRVDGLSTTVKNQAGDISSLQQTASSLSSTVRSHTGSISSLQQTADSLTSTVQSQAGSISQISQTVNNIRLVAVTPTGGGAQLELTNGQGGTDTIGLTLSAVDGKNGGSIVKLGVGSAEISSPEIIFKGMVTFADLKGEGEPTVITGDNITTGTISAVNFVAIGNSKLHTTNSQFLIRDEYADMDIGGIRYDFVNLDKSFADKIYLYTNEFTYEGTLYYPSVKLESVGRISIQADDATHGMVYISGGGAGVTIQCTGAQVDDSAVRIQDNYNTIWTFKNGALYKNGEAVL